MSETPEWSLYLRARSSAEIFTILDDFEWRYGEWFNCYRGIAEVVGRRNGQIVAIEQVWLNPLLRLIGSCQWELLRRQREAQYGPKLFEFSL